VQACAPRKPRPGPRSGVVVEHAPRSNSALHLRMLIEIVTRGVGEPAGGHRQARGASGGARTPQGDYFGSGRFCLGPGAILIIGKRRISITAGIWGTPVRHNNTEPSVHVCAALLGRCGSNFEFSKPLAASPASPNPPTAAARRVRSCTTSRAPRGLLLPPTTRHYATVDNAGSCSPTSHPELPCCARSWPAR
jgi:hypothetical protein